MICLKFIDINIFLKNEASEFQLKIDNVLIIDFPICNLYLIISKNLYIYLFLTNEINSNSIGFYV